MDKWAKEMYIRITGGREIFGSYLQENLIFLHFAYCFLELLLKKKNNETGLYIPFSININAHLTIIC